MLQLLDNLTYTDKFLYEQIGCVVKYWTNVIVYDFDISLDVYTVDENGYSGSHFYKPHHKEFPWCVDIIDMHFPAHTNYKRKDIYKINFNLQTHHIHSAVFDGDKVTKTYKGIHNYKVNETQIKQLEDFFKGHWLNYMTIQQCSRIIVEFRLDDYFPIFRKEKLLKIQNKLLSL